MGEDRELIEMFIEETRERLELIEPALVELERAETPAEKERLLNEVFRHLHSTKGSAGYLNLSDLVALVHAAEHLADVLRKGAPVQPDHVDLLLQTVSQTRAYLAHLAGQGEPPSGLGTLTERLQRAATVATEHPITSTTSESQTGSTGQASQVDGEGRGEESRTADAELTSSTVRVPVHVLDRLGRLAEEMLVTRNRITALAANLQDGELVGASKKLSVMVSELQDIAALTRLQPISSLFAQMPRVVRDAARVAGKEVDLVIDGGRLEVDRRILQGSVILWCISCAMRSTMGSNRRNDVLPSVSRHAGGLRSGRAARARTWSSRSVMTEKGLTTRQCGRRRSSGGLSTLARPRR